MKTRKQLYLILLITALSLYGRVNAQQKNGYIRCATMEVLNAAFKKNPALKLKFEQNEAKLEKVIARRRLQPLREEAYVNIPIVFHIVLTNPSLVTDAEIQAQLDTLNRDFAGTNGDSVKIPGAFKSLFGKSNIQFCLAQRTPDGEPTDGIERVTTSISSFSVSDSRVKYTASGGADAWDPDRYFNVWLTNMSGGILGYATMPGTSVAAEEGVVILYSSVPGGDAAPYNEGKTLTHETGHYFNLYHTWGDDNGACTGTDYVDDTPNQSNYTYGCPDGSVVTDNCTTTAPGILYEDYMDYTDDDCMEMFTNGQVTRMEAALNTYRASLLTSDGCTPVTLKDLDPDILSINTPPQRICSSTLAPEVTIRNKGAQTLTSLDIYASVDGGTPVVTNWTGSLASLVRANVSLTSLAIPEGQHTLTVYITNPNGGTDMDPSNDTLSTSFQYYGPVTPPLSEGFEDSSFPPAGWDIVNPDHSYTWERVTGIAKTGNASIEMPNLEYQQNDQKDYIRLPQINIADADSVFLTFQVAAAVQTNPSTTNNVWDTLQVLLSTDCGETYTSLYKKWGSSLITRQTATTSRFIPSSSEWRKDSVNLTPYINAGPILLAFQNTTEYENDIYLDDINLYKVVINPNLKSSGFLVTPNPGTGKIAVQFYPNPANLKGILIYSVTGRKVAQVILGKSVPSTYYSFDLSRDEDGIYIVRVVFSDKTLTKKFIIRH